MPSEKEEGIWCNLCGEKILGYSELKKAKEGKIGWLDRGRINWIKMVAGLAGIPTYNTVHAFAMMKVYKHFKDKHKKELEREIKKNGGKRIWEWIVVKGKEKMEELGVHF